jgi:beta-phosphoglucomutase
MHWIQNYQLFLFDFDGLLVDTERVHFAAYAELCRRYGYALPWDFEQFCREAHGKAMGVWEGLFREFPGLVAQQPSKEALYEEKKAIYVELLAKSKLELMDGAAELLAVLAEKGAKRAVVTNSPRSHIELIQVALPQLKSIPLWVTREDYAQPKPSPEGYLKAIQLLGVPGDRVIGFEDTAKGLKALLGAGVEGVLVCPAQQDHVSECVALGAKHCEKLSLISNIYQK